MEADNQGVKGETFIQIGRRGGDGKPGWRGHGARWQLMDQAGEASAGRPGYPTFACG